ncbi:MAG: glutamate 5-kinase [Candidatus Hadarchaeales archaeon]
MEGHDFRKKLAEARRIVVKVGTSSLTGRNSGLDPVKVGRLVSGIMKLRESGREVILVSSGAIGAGISRLNMKKRPKEMSKLQAAAAVGQGILMQVYSRYFNEYGQIVAQMLLTGEDFLDKKRYQNFRNTMQTLLKWGAVPVINENDTVEIEEIRLGDNDTLSAYVAVGSRADLLIILSDVDGVYMKRGGKKSVIKTVERVTKSLESLAEEEYSGTGGIRTKIRAARIATRAGIPVVVANSAEKNVLEKIVSGAEIGTIFLPVKRP